MAKVIQYLQPVSLAAPSGEPGTASDQVRVELMAMQKVGDALARLPDDTARQRVLKWAREVFQAEEEKPPVPADPYEDLALGNAEEWFQPALPEGTGASQDAADASQPVVSMIHGFVADFQKLARDWKEE